MVDVEPFLEAPFEEASNLSFEVLLLLGVGLLAAVSVIGRSTVTTAAVVVYLCLIPAYVGFRIRVWDQDETDSDEADGANDIDAPEDGERADEGAADGDGD